MGWDHRVQLLAHRSICCGFAIGAKRTSTKIYDGVDAPPDGIDVPKWRC